MRAAATLRSCVRRSETRSVDERGVGDGEQAGVEAAATVMRVELLGVEPKTGLRFPDFGARGVRKPTRARCWMTARSHSGDAGCGSAPYSGIEADAAVMRAATVSVENLSLCTLAICAICAFTLRQRR